MKLWIKTFDRIFYFLMGVICLLNFIYQNYWVFAFFIFATMFVMFLDFVVDTLE